MTQMCGERIARVCVFECERDIERERECDVAFCVVKSLGNHPKSIFHVPERR